MCTPWLTGARGSFHSEMAKWWAEGWLRADETVFDGGLDAWPAAFAALFSGANVGKVVVRA